MVTVGDRNAELSREERMARIQKGDEAAIGTDPIHKFFVIADADDGAMGGGASAMAAAWEKLGVKTSDDLSKPFNMVRVDESDYVVAEKLPQRKRKQKKSERKQGEREEKQ